jgi:hypothetical protein
MSTDTLDLLAQLFVILMLAVLGRLGIGKVGDIADQQINRILERMDIMERRQDQTDALITNVRNGVGAVKDVIDPMAESVASGDVININNLPKETPG